MFLRPNVTMDVAWVFIKASETRQGAEATVREIRAERGEPSAADSSM